MSIVMYGQPPIDFPPMPIIPGPVVPDATHPWQILPQPQQARPVQPETAEAIAKRLDERIAWLENELRMHDAWQTELALLRRMREAAAPLPRADGEDGNG
jgi:hypothetical protein